MTTPTAIDFRETDLDSVAGFAGRVVVFASGQGPLDAAARRVNRLSRGAVRRLAESPEFARLKPGEARDLAYPAGMAAQAVQVVRLTRRAAVSDARRAGAAIAKAGIPGAGVLVLAAGINRAADLSLGLALRHYDFVVHKTDATETPGPVSFMVARPEETAAEARPMAALAESVFFTRDLINEPANILTTLDFTARLAAMQEIGLDIEILEEPDLEKLGMGALLAVGRGSESPCRVVVMHWRGGVAGAPPLALVGKGVMFDTGGISMKPASGMEDMTKDMGGAGTVAGVMRALALRNAPANVVGIVGLVENMVDARAQRPGDVVRSMKGDTIEVINTDAEGRLVLADLLWYTQERFAPRGMIDLATLTGAIIVALGHEKAGVFANDDALCAAFLKAAAAEDEGAWRMPLDPAFDSKLKSRVADLKNVGGRDGGSIIAAQFLKRFVRDETPWLHLDIAGVALVKADTAFAPKGATGWGVRALDRMIRDIAEDR